jgi:hypothetical protein
VLDYATAFCWAVFTLITGRFYEVLSFEKGIFSQKTIVVLVFRFCGSLRVRDCMSSRGSTAPANRQNAYFKQPKVTSRDTRCRAFRDAGW